MVAIVVGDAVDAPVAVACQGPVANRVVSAVVLHSVVVVRYYVINSEKTHSYISNS